MASAPAIGKPTLPVDLKFELGGRPRVGQALEINLALVPKIDGGPAAVQLSGADGLETTPGETEFEIPTVEAGSVYRHTVSLTPTADGVLLVNLKVSMTHDEVNDSQVFTVPVIVER